MINCINKQKKLTINYNIKLKILKKNLILILLSKMMNNYTIFWFNWELTKK